MTYQDHGYQAIRPRRQPDRTNLRLEGPVLLETESRRQYTSPWYACLIVVAKN